MLQQRDVRAITYKALVTAPVWYSAIH